MRHIKIYESFSCLFESNIDKFLSGKKFKNPKSKIFLYHGTDMIPSKFKLIDDYDNKAGHGWGGDLPEGYLFMTTSVEEASAYGKYIIPCELKRYDHIFFKINTDNPSQVFDDDYMISTIRQSDNHFGFWEKFEEKGKSCLIIKGTKRWTVITDINNVIPRIDLANEFYNSKTK